MTETYVLIRGRPSFQFLQKLIRKLDPPAAMKALDSYTTLDLPRTPTVKDRVK